MTQIRTVHGTYLQCYWSSIHLLVIYTSTATLILSFACSPVALHDTFALSKSNNEHIAIYPLNVAHLINVL